MYVSFYSFVSATLRGEIKLCVFALQDWIIKTALSDTDVSLEWIHSSRLTLIMQMTSFIVLLDSSHEGIKLGLHMNVDKCKIG